MLSMVSLCKVIPLIGEMSAQRTKGCPPAEQGLARECVTGGLSAETTGFLLTFSL